MSKQVRWARDVQLAVAVNRAEFTVAGLASVVPGFRRVEEGEPYHVHIWIAWWRLVWPPWRKRIKAVLAHVKPAHVRMVLHYAPW